MPYRISVPLLCIAPNLGLTRMADSCGGASLRQLAHLHDWHIGKAAYVETPDRLIDAHRAMPLAGLSGSGISSSNGAQQSHAGGQGAAISDINARNGNESGLSFYTHILDQYDPSGSRVIAATVGETPCVLDGLLYHQTGLSIEEHYTDTGPRVRPCVRADAVPWLPFCATLAQYQETPSASAVRSGSGTVASRYSR